MKLRLFGLLTAFALVLTMFGSLLPGSAAEETLTASAADSDFYFANGQMSEQVLRNYLSRAVTYMGLCAEGNRGLNNLGIEEDIRFLLRTGTKFVSRAALFAWACTSASEVEKHYEYAEINAKKVHAADPEIILQAFTAEIVHKGVVNNMEIPAWVFEAFGEEPEKRNFVFDDMIIESLGPNYWGPEKGVPDWSRPEAQRWFYYCMVRYIDAGYESIHCPDASYITEKGAFDPADLAAVDKVLTMCRQYAKTHARRGLVLFHNFFPMEYGCTKIGDRLVFDIAGNGLVPNETEYNEDTGAYECKISYPEGSYWCTWFGRATGGEHPLGFTVETCPTILEFDNYGPLSMELNVSNGPAFGTWGYDDITWFATQPEEYRNQFLKYLDEYTSTNCLSSTGERQYYILYPGRRCITPQPNYPVIKYTPGELFNVDYLLDCGTQDRFAAEAVKNIKGTHYELTCYYFYRANRNSDGCPLGFNQEDTIREIFLGKNAPEDPKWDTVVLPAKYMPEGTDTTTKGNAVSTTKKPVATTKGTGNQSGTATTTPGVADSVPDDTVSAPADTDMSTEETSLPDTSVGDAVPDSSAEASTDDAASAGTSKSDDVVGGKPAKAPVWPFIVGGVVLLAAVGVIVLVVIKKKQAV
ncbi:MAG: hypothetical protein IJZ13_09000 [Clostridia bacterium]|nr:hypothetical protein [Clostridia bacterium]